MKVALLNFNLRKKSLRHSINVSDALYVICDEDTEPFIAETQDELKCKVNRIVFEKEFGSKKKF